MSADHPFRKSLDTAWGRLSILVTDADGAILTTVPPYARNGLRLRADAVVRRSPDGIWAVTSLVGVGEAGTTLERALGGAVADFSAEVLSAAEGFLSGNETLLIHAGLVEVLKERKRMEGRRTAVVAEIERRQAKLEALRREAEEAEPALRTREEDLRRRLADAGGLGLRPRLGDA